MQSILTLDLSTTPAEVLLCEVEGSLIEVIERRAVDLNYLTNRDVLLSPEFATARNGGVPAGDDGSANEDLPELELGAERLQAVLNTLPPNWTNPVVIVPPVDSLSLNIDLPFGDTKSIGKIIDLEVQDVVPFEVEEFLVHYRALGAPNSSSETTQNKSGFDVFVSMIPKRVVRNVLALCRKAGLEPFIVTTSASSVGAVYGIAKDYFKDNSALIVCEDPYYHLATFIDGELRSERVIRRESSAEESIGLQRVFTELRLSIGAVERRYSRRIEHTYITGQVNKLSQLQQVLGRSAERFSLQDVVKAPSDVKGVGCLASLFARDDAPHPILTNFRSREFSYSPRFHELISGLRNTAGYFMAALTSVMIALLALYFAREYRLSKMDKALKNQIRLVIPDFQGNDDNVLTSLRDSETALSDQLGALGSPSKITPLDALVEISKDMPTSISGLSTQVLKVTSSRITLEGIAPDLSAIDKVEKALRGNKHAYGKVSVNTGSSTGTKGYRFTVEIVLNQ